MKNFIFKSKDKSSDLYKIHVALELILTEHRHLRSDIAHIIRHMNTKDMVQREDTEHIPEEEQ